MTARMQELMAMTEMLPELDAIEFPMGGSVVTFESKPGTNQRGFGVGVYRDPDLGMMRGCMAQDNTVVRHQHGDNFEWIGVAKGSLEITFENPPEIKVLAEHEACKVDPGRTHQLRAITDVTWWSVSMPPAAGYPSVEICPFAAKHRA